MENEVMFIKLDDIIPNRFQPREVFEEDALNKLADSIRRHGVIEPILVRPVSNKFEIIAGERRYKASVLAGLTKIPAIVKQMDDKESSIVAYIENEHRSDVSAIEEARTIDRIIKNNNMTQEELAKELGINQSTLANKLRLLSLPMEIQNALMHKEISERHARSLLTVKDEAKQIELLNKIRENKMSVRELDSEIKNMNNYGENNEFNDYINNPSPSIPSFNDISNNYSNDNIYANMNTATNEPINNNDFSNYLNNYDNNQGINNPQEDISNDYPSSFNMNDDSLNISNSGDYTDYLNDYSNNPTTDNYNNLMGNNENTQTNAEDPSFMNFLNSYDDNNPLPPEPPVNNNSFESELNNYNNDLLENNNNFGLAEEPKIDNNDYLNNDFMETMNNNVVINDVTPPITSNFNNNSYIESNPNFVDVSKEVVIDSVDDIINKLKVVVDEIKDKSKFKIDTDEINYDDIYQITIKIDKRDF